MKLQRINAVAKKEFLHVLRDPRSLGLGLAIPMLLLFLFGYALKLDVENVPFIVWDQSDSHVSREFVARFAGSRYFSLLRHAGSYREVEKAIDRREAQAALVIPVDFAREVGAGRQGVVQFILDGSDSNTATFAKGYAEAVAAGFSQEISLRQLQRMGAAPAVPLDVRPRVWFNADMLSRNFIVPGLIAVIMMVIAALLTSLTIVRERETGTMEQLISTPLTGPELILGKLIPYFAIALLDLLLAVIVGKFVFHVPLRGSVALLFGMATVFTVGALSLGMLFSIIARNQLMASQLALVGTLMPAFLLSGFVFPIANMPEPVQALTHLISARYFIILLRGLYLKGVGLETLAGEALFLVIFSSVVLTLAIRKFRKKIT